MSDEDREPPDAGTGAGADDPGSPFAEVDVADVDEEAVLAELAGSDGEPGADERPAGDDGVVVPKESYCRRCEHFSAPPAVACEHPGTRIVELVGVDRFRVVDCPVVRRRHEAAEGVFRPDAGDGE